MNNDNEEQPNAYLEKVRLKRKKNQDKMNELGLDKFTPQKQQTPVVRKNKLPRVITPLKGDGHGHGEEVRRRSSRVSKKPVEFVSLVYDEQYEKQLLQNKINRRAADAASQGPLPKKRKYDLGDQITPSQREQYTTIPPEQWVPDLQYYFSHVEGNSASNVQRVMVVVRKLVAGTGVRHPQTQAFFLEGVKGHLGMDFRALLDEASGWVYENGGDRGNGWLIEHGLKKLWVYQQARASNGNKAFSEAEP